MQVRAFERYGPLIHIAPANRASTHAFCCKYLLALLTYQCVEANSVDPDQEPLDWVHTVCLNLH